MPAILQASLIVMPAARACQKRALSSAGTLRLPERSVPAIGFMVLEAAHAFTFHIEQRTLTAFFLRAQVCFCERDSLRVQKCL